MNNNTLQPGDLFNCGADDNYRVTRVELGRVLFYNVRTKEKFENYSIRDTDQFLRENTWTLLNELGKPRRTGTVKPINKEAILDLIANTLLRGQDDSMTLDCQVNLLYEQWKLNL